MRSRSPASCVSAVNGIFAAAVQAWYLNPLIRIASTFNGHLLGKNGTGEGVVLTPGKYTQPLHFAIMNWFTAFGVKIQVWPVIKSSGPATNHCTCNKPSSVLPCCHVNTKYQSHVQRSCWAMQGGVTGAEIQLSTMVKGQEAIVFDTDEGTGGTISNVFVAHFVATRVSSTGRRSVQCMRPLLACAVMLGRNWMLGVGCIGRIRTSVAASWLLCAVQDLQSTVVFRGSSPAHKLQNCLVRGNFVLLGGTLAPTEQSAGLTIAGAPPALDGTSVIFQASAAALHFKIQSVCVIACTRWTSLGLHSNPGQQVPHFKQFQKIFLQAVDPYQLTSPSTKFTFLQNTAAAPAENVVYHVDAWGGGICCEGRLVAGKFR